MDQQQIITAIYGFLVGKSFIPSLEGYIQPSYSVLGSSNSPFRRKNYKSAQPR